MSTKKSGFGKFVLGALIGAGIGVLFAPKKGSETRKELMIKIDELVTKIKKIDMVDVKDSLLEKLDNLKEELADLDKEKVLKIAKEKGAQLKEKADELVKVAVAKGTPILEKAAKDVRTKTIEVVEDVLKKLKEKDKAKSAE